MVSQRAVSVKGEIVTVSEEDAHLLDNTLYIYNTNTTRYVLVYIEGKTKKLSRLIMGNPNGFIVDHINGNPLDNRRDNLRICTIQQNNWNRRRRGCGVVPFKGVTYRKSPTNCWRAHIWPSGKQIYLGAFPTAKDAALAYDTAARNEYGEFACLNFPDHGEQSSQRPKFHTNIIA